mmetsp:Transcript_60451/g.91163  ORF Transcript_60451/g.91163 Transcript_60451/m.91163 type:complete len:216 (-) Transcript_60451:24-671(-)
MFISNNNRTQRTVFSMDDRIIYRPKLMKTQNLFIILSNSLHLSVRLISNNMVNKLKPDWISYCGERVIVFYRNKSREKWSLISLTFNKSVNSITVSLNCGHDNSSIFVRLFPRFFNYFGAICFRGFENSAAVVNVHGNIFYTVTMFNDMITKNCIIWVERGGQTKNNISLFDNMRNYVAATSFKAAISNSFKTKAGNVESCCLCCVSYNESAVME